MTKQRIEIYEGQRAKYAGKVVTIIGQVERVESKGWRLKVRDERGVEMLAIPTLVVPLGKPSARRGRVYLGYIEREFNKALAEAAENERGLAS